MLDGKQYTHQAQIVLDWISWLWIGYTPEEPYIGQNSVAATCPWNPIEHNLNNSQWIPITDQSWTNHEQALSPLMICVEM